MKPFCIFFLSAFISISSIAQNLIQNPDFEDGNGNLDCSYWETYCKTTINCNLNKNLCGCMEFVSDSTSPVSKFSFSTYPCGWPGEYFINTYITGISGIKIYKLELWMRTNFTLGHAAIGITRQNEFIESKKVRADPNDTLKKYTLIDTLDTQQNDSITIRLSSGVADLCGTWCKTFFTKIDFREFDPTTSNVVEDYKTDLVNVFSNPVREILNFKLNNQHLIEEIEVFSSGGKSVGLFNTNKIDVNDLSKGLYFYKLKLKGGIIKTGKFIKA